MVTIFGYIFLCSWFLFILIMFVVAVRLECKQFDLNKLKLEDYLNKYKPSDNLCEALRAYKKLNKRDKLFLRYVFKFANVEDLAVLD